MTQRTDPSGAAALPQVQAQPSCGRRALLQCGAAACAGTALAQLPGCAPRIPVPTAIALDAPVDNIVTVALTRVPELLTPGGSLLLHPEGTDASGRPRSILVVNSSDQGLLAWDAYCPHQFCELSWDDGETEAVCPCHLSRFGADGRVKNPPATADLTPHKVALQRSNQVLTVDLSGDVVYPPATAAAGGSVITFAIADLPALAKVGGTISGYAKGVAFPILVVRTSATEVEAYDARCPHLGCQIFGAGQVLICKCH
ncbi:MAG: Rieske 2Fe-2S domain-containing protein, partial [Deltaproteobacteria bacterium]|nr:Rieske 2Fe-2S domain-containing protein [Deltaproteobacteria bacterium]